MQYRIVDVFTQVPLEGNALAVFLDGSGLDTRTMQRIAREMNLSETVFIVPAERADCAAHVRIFTPGYEMAFAGHPTIGGSFVLREMGALGDARSFNLQEKVGPVAVRFDDDGSIWLTTPPITERDSYDPAACARALNLDRSDLLAETPCQVLTAGNPTLYIAARDKGVVDRAVCDAAALERLLDTADRPICMFVFAPTAEGAYSRMFAPEHGIVEDPATGSSTGPLAAFMMRHGLAPHHDGTRFVSEQGTKMGRRSLLHVWIHGDFGSEAIEVGGFVTPVASGVMTI